MERAFGVLILIKIKMKGKYIIFERNGLEFPVLFPDHFVGHDQIKGTFSDKPVAAGKWYLGDGRIMASGSSVSLGLKSRPEDSELITKQLKG